MADDEAEVPRAIERRREARADQRGDAQHAKQIVCRDRRLKFLRSAESTRVVHPLVGVHRSVFDDGQCEQVIEPGVDTVPVPAPERLRCGPGARALRMVTRNRLLTALNIRVGSDAEAQRLATTRAKAGLLSSDRPPVEVSE